MKYIDEFRDSAACRKILDKIRKISRKKANIMEICGTHTHSISRYGIRQALPENLRLISGPGCPVCVTSASDIERVIRLTRGESGIIVATFGDMLRVPSLSSSLQEERAMGADIRVVYSPLGCLSLAAENPDKEVVFYAVGFETTAPTVAATILEAQRQGIKNLSIIPLHKLTPPAMKALLDSGDVRIDGFICPGHVTAIIGARSYEFLSADYASPCVVAGFEPVDALLGLYMLIEQIEQGRHAIEIQYKRVVTWEGNLKAQEIINEVFAPTDAAWRGIGTIPLSGLGIKNKYSEFDAQKRFNMPECPEKEPEGCKCGRILKGTLAPDECPLFGSQCTPETPAGPCMVSSEGTCAAYYKYRKAG